MEAELVVQPNRKITLSSFKKHLDGSGVSVLVVKSGRFSYSTPEFNFDNLQKFTENLKQVYRSLSGTAELSFIYESEHIKFEAKSRGHIEFSAEFIEYGDIQQVLSCGFEFDQSYLPEFIQQLECVVKTVYS